MPTADAPIFHLPEEIHLVFCARLLLPDLLSLRRTCRYFWRITHDVACQPKTLDTNECSKYPYYLLHYLKDPARCAAVEQLIISHSSQCIHGYTESTSCAPVHLCDRYGLVDSAPTFTPEYRQSVFFIPNILADCPNIRQLCVPKCRNGDLYPRAHNPGLPGFVKTIDDRMSEVAKFYTNITHLQTNTHAQEMIYLFPNVRKVNVDLDADFMDFLTIAPVDEITLTWPTDDRYAYAYGCDSDRKSQLQVLIKYVVAWFGWRKLRTFRLNRPRETTTIEELEEMVAVLDVCKASTACKLEFVQIWDMSDTTRETERWKSILEARSFLTFHEYAFSIYDNSNCEPGLYRPTANP